MSNNWRAVLRNKPGSLDAALIVLLIAAAVAGTPLEVQEVDTPARWWPGVLIASAASLALLARRRRPLPVAVFVLSCTVLMAAVGYVMTALLLAPLMIALYSVAVFTKRRTTNVLTLVAVVLVAGTGAITSPNTEAVALKVVGPIALILLPAALGSTARFRRALIESIRARADLAELSRDEEARRRVLDERIRIARDLHDVVAHHLALANAQASTVAHVLRTQPEQAQKIVDQLAQTTSAALREMKNVVGVLRQDREENAVLEPSPGLDQVPALVDSLNTAGLIVDMSVVGLPRPLDTGADLTAYRVIQEALTNVTKHAGVNQATVRIAYMADRVVITVGDRGTRALIPGGRTAAGYGIIGMHERALAVGGSVSAGQRNGGGFEVTCDLPLHSNLSPEGSES